DALCGGPRKVERVAVPATRVALESREPMGVASPIATDVPATRYAGDAPASAGVPETRFSDRVAQDVPATRIADAFTTAQSPLPSRESWLTREGRQWRSDRRRWLAGALLVVAVGASAAKFASAGPEKPDNGKVAGGQTLGGGVVPDTQSTAATVGVTPEPETREAPQLPVVGSLQDVGGGKATPTTPPSGGRARRPTPVAPVAVDPRPTPPVVVAPPETVAPPPVVAPRGVDPSAREGAFRAALTTHVDHFVQAIRTRDVATVERLLLASGTNRAVHDQLIALMRAGRVEVSDVNVTNRSRTDAGGSGQFDATLNFRSPFGANRKTPIQFVVDVSGDSGDWNLVSARVIGSPKFR
ncbi:MAG: hypothetical protein ABMA00_10925, partial [Gemmatimonas sp.]